MPSPIRSGGDPAPINPGSADAVSDLPASQWPSMERIAVVDLVGPGAANRQVRALQRRTRVLADNLNRNTAVLNYVSGYAAVPGDYARKVQAAGTVPLAAGPAQVADDLEHYLARDGSSVMWGRLSLGHTRSLMFTSAFDTNANHWVQGPGSADVALADADRIWGIKRLGVNDYELYVWRLSNPYRVLTTYDFPAGPTSFLASGSNNDRLVTTAGGASLFVEASYAATDTPAKLGVAITGQSSLYLRALKGNAAYTDICREGTSGYNGAMMRFEGSQATRAYPFIYTKPISVSAAFGYGIAIGHAPHGSPTEWGATDYGYQAIQSAYGELLRFAFATRQSVTMGNGDSTLTSGASSGANSCISVYSPGTSDSRPSYGFVKTGVSQCALYYDGDSGARPALKVMNGSGTFTLAFGEDFASVSDTLYTTAGDHTFNVPTAGVYDIVVVGGGGGGGGGGGQTDGQGIGGSGGGAGAVTRAIMYLAAGDYTAHVGGGGAGGAGSDWIGANGSAGGCSYFGTGVYYLYAGPGAGGPINNTGAGGSRAGYDGYDGASGGASAAAGAHSGGVGFNGAAAGVAAGGDQSYGGGGGGGALVRGYSGATYGTSVYGTNGEDYLGRPGGTAGQGYGAGGGGGAGHGDGLTSGNGGAGAAGCVRITRLPFVIS